MGIVQKLEKEAMETSAGMYKGYSTEEQAKKYIFESNVYIIYQDMKPVGIVSYDLENPKYAHVHGLVISGENRGKGFGKKAIEWLLNELKNVEKVDLITHPHNTSAIMVYLKNGFKIVCWLDNFLGDGKPRIGLAKEMKKKL